MKAIITGVNGQDGSYLAESLLLKGYEVLGIYRRASSRNWWRLASCLHNSQLRMLEGDITDSHFISSLLKKEQPELLFNTAAQSHVHSSFKQPDFTFNVNFNGVLNILEAIKNFSPNTRMLQCSTSEMFGNNADEDNDGLYQDEETAFQPRSPYAISKVAAHQLMNLYKDSYDIFACCAITHNHESPRRGEEFVTRKITKWIYDFKKNTNKNFPKLRLGNIYSYRDWGHAKDYCEAFYKIIKHSDPDNFMVATGKAHSVKDFLSAAFNLAGLGDWEDYVIIDPELYRPAEVDYLKGKPEKILRELGWHHSLSFNDLIFDMVTNETGSSELTK